MNFSLPTQAELAHVVARFNGTEERNPSLSKGGLDPEIERFEPAFEGMLDGSIKGGMTEFVFFTPDNGQIIGGKAWDIVCTSEEYAATTPFQSCLNTALHQGLMDLLPMNIKFVENGPGTKEQFLKKTGALCSAVTQSSNHEVSSVVVIDKSRRYAEDAAILAKRELGVNETIAMVGNFMTQRSRINEGQGTPVVLTWGFPFANAPITNSQSAMENAEEFFFNMHRQHGLSSCFLIEVDLTTDPDVLKKTYATQPPSKGKRHAFANFTLSGIYRAAHNGTIKNRGYKVGNMWEAVTEVTDETVTITDEEGKEAEVTYPLVSLSAVSKRNHEIITSTGRHVVNRDDAPRPQILSHKWNEAIYRHLAMKAGATDIHFFRHGTRGLMFGKFTRKIS